MTAATQEILATALSLPFDEKAALVDALLASMRQIDPQIERSWDEEVCRRLRAYEVGEAVTYSAEEVLEELRWS